MLVTRLAEHARATGLADADPAFERKPVRWALVISPSGEFRALIDLATEASRSGQVISVPRKIGANAGGVASLAVDSARFVLELTKGASSAPAEAVKAGRDHKAFVELHEDAARQLPGDPGLEAAARFLRSDGEVGKARQAAEAHKVDPNDRVALQLEDAGGELLCLSDSAQRFWRKHYAERAEGRSSGTTARCLSCGSVKDAVQTNDIKIMNVASIGGQPSGAALVSFDKEAFQSYGWEQNLNASTCRECTFAYTQALNHLLRYDNTPRTRLDLAGTAYLMWTDPGAGVSLNIFDEPDPEAAARLLLAAESGNLPPEESLKNVYLVGLKGNGGRLAVTEWFELTVEQYHRNLARWFRDIQITLARDQRRGGIAIALTGHPSAPFSLADLSEATAIDRDHIQQGIPRHLLRAALRGEPLPASVLTACLRRFQAEGFSSYLTPARIGLVRCALNRTQKTGGPSIMPGLDPENTDPAYLCGRLLAVLESVQYQGVGDVGATIVDRYYGRASTAPSLVFGQLLSLAQSHLKAIGSEATRIALSQRIADIVGKLDSRFPTRLSLEEQGRFAIGYYHQRAHDFAQARERTRERSEEAQPAV